MEGRINGKSFDVHDAEMQSEFVNRDAGMEFRCLCQNCAFRLQIGRDDGSLRWGD